MEAEVNRREMAGIVSAMLSMQLHTNNSEGNVEEGTG
jgi:hypothetical protein